MELEDVKGFGEMISTSRYNAAVLAVPAPQVPPTRPTRAAHKDTPMKLEPNMTLADGVTVTRGSCVYDVQGNEPEMSIIDVWVGLGDSFYVTAVNGRHQRRRNLSELYFGIEAAYRHCHAKVDSTLNTQLLIVQKNEHKLSRLEHIMLNDGFTPPVRVSPSLTIRSTTTTETT
jgi:hypothetical protein